MANSSLDDRRAFASETLKDIDDEELKSHIRRTKEELFTWILNEGIAASKTDPSIYTGISGIALVVLGTTVGRTNSLRILPELMITHSTNCSTSFG